MRPRFLAAAATLALGAAAPRVARADGEPLGARLSWARGPGAASCVDGAALTARVARWMQRSPAPGDHPASIEGTVAREGRHWRVRLVVRRPDDSLVGVREFASDAAACGAVVDAAVLVIALNITTALDTVAPPAPDPHPPPAPDPPPPQPAQHTETPPTPPAPHAPPAPPPAPPATTPRRTTRSLPLHYALNGEVVAAVGVLPGVAFGGAIDAEPFGTGRFHLTVGGYWLPQASPGGDFAGTSFGLLAGRLGACVDAVRTARIQLAGCAGGDVGMYSATGNRLAVGAADRFPWVAAHAGARATVRIVGTLVGLVGLEALVPLVAPRFQTQPMGSGGASEVVFSPWAVALSGYLGLGVVFP